MKKPVCMWAEGCVRFRFWSGKTKKSMNWKCVICWQKCGKFFQRFLGLYRHVPNCLCQQNTQNESKGSDEPVLTLENETSASKHDNSFVFNDSNLEPDLSSINFGLSSNDIIPSISSFVCNGYVEKDYVLGHHQEQSFVFSNTETLTPNEITKSFFTGLLQLNTNEKTMNDVFHLTKALLNSTHKLWSKHANEEFVRWKFEK